MVVAGGFPADFHAILLDRLWAIKAVPQKKLRALEFHGHVPITLSLRKRFNSTSDRPSRSRRISSVCCPSRGGGTAYSIGLADRRIGFATPATWPAVGCIKSNCMPRCRTWGSANTSPRRLIGPQGTPAASSASTQACVVRCRKTGSSKGISAALLATRARLEAKRSSAASPTQPPSSQKRRNWASLPTARMTWPSAVAKVW